jgi:uncharacterized protein YecE (DUF72 family)
MTHQRKAEKKDYDSFKDLVEAGKMAGILAQFPYSFHCNKLNQEYLKSFAANFDGMEVAIEFRNQNWIKEETFHLLKNENLAFVSVNEPDMKGLVKNGRMIREMLSI